MSSAHRFLQDLAMVHLPSTGKILYMPASDCYLIEWGPETPTGTAVSKYFLVTTPLAKGTALYANIGGTWTAMEWA
jgi:hypothetical protein